jgi:paraquat-inducible protein B
MAAKASKTVIGAFVVGAVALAVAGIMVFGSGKFFKKRYKYIIYFDASVKGLNIGAPVLFKGVRIGEVVDIILRFDPSDQSINIPVIVELEPDKLKRVRHVAPDPDKNLKLLIERGLRAQLQLQSFVTAQLMVGMDFFPDQQPRYAGIESEYTEIPTVPTAMEQIAERLQDIPIDEIIAKLNNTLEGINTFVNSPDLTGSVKSLNQTLKDAGQLLKDVDKQVEPLVASIESTSEAARGALIQAEKTLAMEEGTPGELVSDLRATLKGARSSLSQLEQTLQSMEGSVSKDSRVVYELNTTLREVKAAARSIRILTETIEREPEALFRGRKGSKGE